VGGEAGPCAEPIVATPDEPIVTPAGASGVAAAYDKREVRIPMRDGVQLFTSIYTPKSRPGPLPILLQRTPYSVRPYGPDAFRDSVGPSPEVMQDGYIVVYQDVRGRYMSEGTFENMRPHVPKAKRRGPADIDESTDTYDTIEWLMTNVDGHNGKVGMWGISYPGFYAAAGMIDAHPALAAVSPQAPIADWWYDDFHHHGAFFLPHAFNFFVRFGLPRPAPTPESPPPFSHGTPDGYAFFLGLGSLEAAKQTYLAQDTGFWQAFVDHPDYDAFWAARDLLPHLREVAPAVLTVGGWFDAEDLYGPLEIYRALEKNAPRTDNRIVMGPWRHGGWARSDGDHLGNVDFGSKTAIHYRGALERVFFRQHLHGEGAMPEGDAFVFDTGALEWRAFPSWPPADLSPQSLFLGEGGVLAGDVGRAGTTTWVSDPAKPVPFTEDIDVGMTADYMTDDQRFASRRPDVVTFRSEVLREALTIAGPIDVELWLGTDVAAPSGDMDVIVKLVDVFPGDAPDHEFLDPGRRMGGYEMMVRSEVVRGRYRDDRSKPKPFVPGKPTRVRVPLLDVLHTFQPGHRIMIQVQSTWFPLVDRNPQRWVDNVFLARAEDFTRATHSLLFGKGRPSRIAFSRLVPARLHP
jgi:putative CocE/NonD family hydrolase